MINKVMIKELVKSYLPDEAEETIEFVADDVVKEAEFAIFSLTRQAAMQQRVKLLNKKYGYATAKADKA